MEDYKCLVTESLGLAKLFRARVQIAHKFRRNSFACPWNFWRTESLGAFHNYY